MDVARRVRRSGLLCVAILALGASAAAALPGDLDDSFNGTGMRFYHYGGGGLDNAATALIQPDGKIVLSGMGQQPGSTESDAVVSRLNLDGSTDSSFGGGGTGAVSFDFGHVFGGGKAAFAPDGKIVLVGGTETFGPGGQSDNIVAARLNPDGTPDGSFGPGGERQLLGTDSLDASVAVQSTGKPVIVNTTTDLKWAVSRLTTDGKFDGTFAGAGRGQAILPINGAPRAVTLDAGDKIVVAGVKVLQTTNDVVVARLNADGTPDTTFDADGIRDLGPGDAQAVAVQPDHRIIVVGDGNAGGMRVMRLNPDGSPDSSFGNDGVVDITFEVGEPAGGTAVALQPDGKILAAGGTGGDIGGDFAVARLQPGGALDTTFSFDGKQTADFNGDIDFAKSVALEPNGSIVLAGQKGSTGAGAVAVVRLQGDAGGTSGGGTGGSGNGSPPRCGGERATIVGTSHADHLKGTKHADVIAGLGGNDKISGLGGNDVICGGAGNDKLSGGGGKDKLYGQSGKDKLTGGAGNDVLSGGAGKDSLAGGAGKDRLSGGSGKDSLNGGNGNDSCSGHDHKKSC